MPFLAADITCCQLQHRRHITAFNLTGRIRSRPKIGNDKGPNQRCSAGTSSELFDERTEVMDGFAFD